MRKKYTYVQKKWTILTLVYVVYLLMKFKPSYNLEIVFCVNFELTTVRAFQTSVQMCDQTLLVRHLQYNFIKFSFCKYTVVKITSLYSDISFER